jgi:hypothetical protein
MGPARMRESLTTTPGIRERPRPKSVMAYEFRRTALEVVSFLEREFPEAPQIE